MTETKTERQEVDRQRKRERVKEKEREGFTVTLVLLCTCMHNHVHCPVYGATRYPLSPSALECPWRPVLSQHPLPPSVTRSRQIHNLQHNHDIIKKLRFSLKYIKIFNNFSNDTINTCKHIKVRVERMHVTFVKNIYSQTDKEFRDVINKESRNVINYLYTYLYSYPKSPS